MNEKKQAIVLLSLVLALLVSLFLYHVQQLETRMADLVIESDARDLNTTMQTLQKYSYAKYAERIKNLLLSDPRIAEAFAARDRERLQAVSRIKYDSLRRENPYFHIMQFHLPEGTTFLRMHRPAFFGDTLTGRRAMVAEVHRKRAPVSGFGFCSDGLFFRVIQPVFVDKEYVGAVEFGIRGQEVVAAIRENLEAMAITFFRAHAWLKAARTSGRHYTEVGDFVVLCDNRALLEKLPASFYEEQHDRVIAHEGRSFRVHNHQIFQDHHGESIGGVILFQDITAALEKKQAFFWRAVLVSLLLFLLSAALLYVSFERILRSLLGEVATRQKKEVEVEEREAHIRLLLNSTAEGIFGLDNEGRCTFVNRSCLEMLGYEHEEELLGVTLHDLIHYSKPDGSEFPMAECPMCRSYHGGQEVCIDDEVLWCKDGRAIPVCYHAYPIRQEGRLLGSVVSFSDITRRKQAEYDKERLTAAIEHAADEIIITDLNGSIEYVNPAFEQVTGYSRYEVMGKAPSVLKSGRHSEEFYRDLWETISAGMVWSSRIINRIKDGTLIEEDAVISPIFDGKGRIIGYVAVKRDVTDKVRMEERLRQANKMESLGTLAGAIAHDFNNILNGIIGLTSLSLLETEARGKIAANLNEIMRTGETAKELVRQILAFTRKESSEYKALALQDVAKDVVKLLRCTISGKIKIVEQLDGDCPAIWGNRSQMHQVVMNLGTNAYQAMRREGGVLTVTVSQCSEPGAWHGEEGRRLVRLVISDTGCGMAPEVQKHIFEPYFTTKKEGEGTGFGLATVHKVVSAHHGTIDVQSEPGQGTTFTLTFPVHEEQQGTAADETAPLITSELSGHVLFVDDAAVNVMLGQEILQSAGCRVTGFTDSAQALEAFRQEPEAFDLLVTDHVMPGLSGVELVSEVKRLRRDIPVLMITGYDDPAHDEELNQCGIDQFLAKPISVKRLLVAAAFLLADAGGAAPQQDRKNE